MGFKVDFGWLSCPRFREDDVVGQLWIPAFAGMTGAVDRKQPRRPFTAAAIYL